MQKAPDAFRTISEVSEILDVPQHVLRFWETRFSQIRPMKRAGGRRYYRPQDIDLLRGIRRLLYDEGYTIKGVQKILRQHGVAHVIAVGRGELAVLPAGGVLPANDQALADARAETVGAETKGIAATPRIPAKVTTLKQPGQSAGLGQALRQTLEQVLRELEEARELLLQSLGEDAPAPPDDHSAEEIKHRRGSAG